METPFRQIGKGFCGSIYAIDRAGPASALKREDGGPLRSVIIDSEMHIKIEHSIKSVQADNALIASLLNIPQHRVLIRNSDESWWKTNSSRFPGGSSHCNTLITERILPLERPAREKLVDLFCQPQTRDIIKNSRKDEDCLVRPYLGRRKADFASPSQFFTLRNKPLHIFQLSELGLPVEQYAEIMADTLAIIHWHAHVDGNDIEFVIAPPRAGETGFESKVLGKYRLWVLDFDCVKSITMDASGVEQAAKAFFKNDPFYPRPSAKDEQDLALWEVFRKRFLETSKVIIGGSELPGMLIRRLEEIGEEKREQKARLEAE